MYTQVVIFTQSYINNERGGMHVGDVSFCFSISYPSKLIKNQH